MRRIEILAFPDIQLLDVAGPLQVFSSANDFLAHAGEPLAYEPVVVAATPRVRTSAGLVLETTLLPPGEIALDTLVVPGGWGVNAACEDSALVDFVARRSRDAARTASVCSGAFLLATAGLLDGRRAVTHWGRCAEFRSAFRRCASIPTRSSSATASLDLGRRHRRHRSRAGLRRSRSRPPHRARRRPPAGGVPEAPRRPGPVQRDAGAAARRRALRPPARLDPRQSQGRPFAGSAGRARQHEPAQLLAPLPQHHRPHPGPRHRGHPHRSRPPAARARHAGRPGRAPAAASARKKPCAAASCARWAPARELIASGSPRTEAPAARCNDELASRRAKPAFPRAPSNTPSSDLSPRGVAYILINGHARLPIGNAKRRRAPMARGQGRPHRPAGTSRQLFGG